MDQARQKTVALLLALSMVSCATTGRDARDDAFDKHLEALGAQMDAGKITRKEAAMSARDRARELFQDPNMNEIWAYRVMLAEHVETGRTTVEEAAYLDERKVNEVIARAKASTTPPARLFPPAVTCRPDGFGAVRCR